MEILKVANGFIVESNKPRHLLNDIRLNRYLFYFLAENVKNREIYPELFKEYPFLELPEAWDIGPVFPTIYSLWQNYKKQPIRLPLRDIILEEDTVASISVSQVVRLYSGFSDEWMHRDLTAPGSPWSTTYIPDQKNKISYASIIAFYSS